MSPEQEQVRGGEDHYSHDILKHIEIMCRICRDQPVPSLELLASQQICSVKPLKNQV